MIIAKYISIQFDCKISNSLKFPLNLWSIVGADQSNLIAMNRNLYLCLFSLLMIGTPRILAQTEQSEIDKAVKEIVFNGDIVDHEKFVGKGNEAPVYVDINEFGIAIVDIDYDMYFRENKDVYSAWIELYLAPTAAFMLLEGGFDGISWSDEMNLKSMVRDQDGNTRICFYFKDGSSLEPQIIEYENLSSYKLDLSQSIYTDYSGRVQDKSMADIVKLLCNVDIEDIRIRSLFSLVAEKHSSKSFRKGFVAGSRYLKNNSLYETALNGDTDKNVSSLKPSQSPSMPQKNISKPQPPQKGIKDLDIIYFSEHPFGFMTMDPNMSYIKATANLENAGWPVDGFMRLFLSIKSSSYTPDRSFRIPFTLYGKDVSLMGAFWGGDRFASYNLAVCDLKKKWSVKEAVALAQRAIKDLSNAGYKFYECKECQSDYLAMNGVYGNKRIDISVDSSSFYDDDDSIKVSIRICLPQ